jgi:hypothetical protein
MKNESLKISEFVPNAVDLFVKEANHILAVYEGNTNLLKRHLFESLALASEGDGPHRQNFSEIVNAHKMINALIDALDPLLEKNELALDGADYKIGQK